jgi:hypothetical protein
MNDTSLNSDDASTRKSVQHQDASHSSRSPLSHPSLHSFHPVALRVQLSPHPPPLPSYNPNGNLVCGLMTRVRPYYVLVANSTNLAFAIVTSCVTSLSMQGLFNLRQTAPSSASARLKLAQYFVHLFLMCFQTRA